MYTIVRVCFQQLIELDYIYDCEDSLGITVT